MTAVRPLRAVLRAAVAVILACGAAAASAQPVPQCVERGADPQGGTRVRNVCDAPISIAWCDASAGPHGPDVPACGDGTPLNGFYTASVVLAPGQTGRLYTDVKWVACNGSGSATGAGGFRSDVSGKYSCPARAPLARDAWPDTMQASSVESAARACALAREAFAPADLAPGDCDCESHPVGSRSVHACSARGRLPERGPAERAYGGLKEWARELMACDPQTDPARCERKRRSVATGVRG